MSVIYTIQCIQNPSLLYVGSTNNLYMRTAKHKSRSKTCNYKLYCAIRENGGWDAFEVKIYKTTTPEEIKKEEALCCKKLKPTLNNNKVYP